MKKEIKEIKEKIIKILKNYKNEIGGISMNYITNKILELIVQEKQKLVEEIELENPLRDISIWAEETENPKKPNIYIKIGYQSYWWEKGLKELENRFIRDLETLKQRIKNK